MFADRSFGSAGAYDGSMRVPAGGKSEFGAEERIVMNADPVLTGSTKLPTKVAPACSRIVSPAFAAFSADWKSTAVAALNVVVGGGRWRH